MSSEWEEQKLKEVLEKYDAVTIPVHVSIQAQQHVLDMSSVQHILSKAELISVEDCYCRTNMKNCTNPVDVCLCINEKAQTALDERGAQEISIAEALAVLEKSHQAGLVHLAYSEKGKECAIVCSCCSCCCHHLSALQRFGYHDIIAKSDMISKIDESLCSGCGICVDRCQFGAWKLNQGTDIAEIDRESCFGCGVCVSTCPTGAISLVPRK